MAVQVIRPCVDDFVSVKASSFLKSQQLGEHNGNSNSSRKIQSTTPDCSRIAATCSRSLLSFNSDSQDRCGEKSAYLTETVTVAELLAGVRSWVWAEVVILLAWTLPEAPMALR
jgi:hypothetical protein